MWDVSPTDSVYSEEFVSASKLNSETCPATMRLQKENSVTGNSKIAAAETVHVAKCHFTLDLR